jgi:hypothetical protein
VGGTILAYSNSEGMVTGDAFWLNPHFLRMRARAYAGNASYTQNLSPVTAFVVGLERNAAIDPHLELTVPQAGDNTVFAG